MLRGWRGTCPGGGASRGGRRTPTGVAGGVEHRTPKRRQDAVQSLSCRGVARSAAYLDWGGYAQRSEESRCSESRRRKNLWGRVVDALGHDVKVALLVEDVSQDADAAPSFLGPVDRFVRSTPSMDHDGVTCTCCPKGPFLVPRDIIFDPILVEILGLGDRAGAVSRGIQQPERAPGGNSHLESSDCSSFTLTNACDLLGMFVDCQARTFREHANSLLGCSTSSATPVEEVEAKPRHEAKEFWRFLVLLGGRREQAEHGAGGLFPAARLPKRRYRRDLSNKAAPLPMPYRRNPTHSSPLKNSKMRAGQSKFPHHPNYIHPPSQKRSLIPPTTRT